MLNVLLNLTRARITSLFNNKEAMLGLLVLITLCIRLFFLEIPTQTNECLLQCHYNSAVSHLLFNFPSSGRRFSMCFTDTRSGIISVFFFLIIRVKIGL